MAASESCCLPHTAQSLGHAFSRSVSGTWKTERCSPQSAPFPPQPPQKVTLPCSAGSRVSGRRWRTCVLATVRRPNCTDGFPVCSFHEDSEYRDAKDGINRTRFTSPYCSYSVATGSNFPPWQRHRLNRCDQIRRMIQRSSRLKSFRT